MKIRHLLVDDEVITTYLLLIAISSFASLLYSFMYSANKHETLKIKELNSKLFELAAIDGMTGIFNRTTGLKRLEEVIEKIKESKDQLSLCFIDVDNLKQVNDCYGHQEGDRLIVTLIDLIKKHLNQEDIFLRLGGDEFLIGFPGYNKEMTQEKLCIIEKTISDFNLNKTYPYNVSASYGIIVLDPTVYDLSLGDLINLADFNMYEKKMAK